MNKHIDPRDRILHAIAHISDQETDEVFCDQTQDRLGFYVEAELSGEHADRVYPAVARHLAICPDCAEEYESLRDLLVAYSQGTLPNDLPMPALPAPSPVQVRSQWQESLRALLAPLGGIARLPLLGAPRRGSGETELRVSLDNALRLAALASSTTRTRGGETAPSLSNGTSFKLTMTIDADELMLQGEFVPGQPDLRGCTARLYAITATETLTVSHTTDLVLGELGMLDSDPLPLGNYVLTLLLKQGEVPIAWIAPGM